MEFHKKLRKMRVGNGIRSEDAAKELLYTRSKYSEIENGITRLTKEEQEFVLEDMELVIEKLTKTWVDGDKLEWKKVTDDMLPIVKEELKQGKNIIQICVKYGFSDQDLMRTATRKGLDLNELVG